MACYFGDSSPRCLVFGLKLMPQHVPKHHAIGVDPSELRHTFKRKLDELGRQMIPEIREQMLPVLQLASTGCRPKHWLPSPFVFR
eukprot:614946-Pelagomonas_calceolata.AAC.2